MEGHNSRVAVLHELKVFVDLQEEVVLAKEEWELTRLKALRQEEERRAELEEDEMLFTYSRQEAYNQVKKKSKKKLLTSTPKPTRANSSRRSAGSDGTWSSPESEPKRPSRAPSRRSSVNSQASTNSLASNKSAKPNALSDEVKVEKGVKKEKVGKEEGGCKEGDNSLLGTPVSSKNSGARKVTAAGSGGKKGLDGKGLPAQEAMPRMTRARHASGEVLATTPSGMKLRKPLAINIQGDGILYSPRLVSPKQKLLQTPMSLKNKSAVVTVVSASSAQPTASMVVKTIPRSVVSAAKATVTPPRVVQSVGSPIQMPQPWSNPNLVIRTRRAFAKETRKRPSQDSSEGSEIDVENVTSDTASVVIPAASPVTTSSVKPVKLAFTSVAGKPVMNAKPAPSVDLLKTLQGGQLQLSKPVVQNANKISTTNVSSMLNALSSVASAVRTMPSASTATGIHFSTAAASSLLTSATRNASVSSSINLTSLPSVVNTSLANVRPLTAVSASTGTVRMVASPSMAVGTNGKPSVLLVSGASPGVVRTSTVTQASNPNNTVPILEKMAMQLQGFSPQVTANSSASQTRPQQIIIVQSRPQQIVVQQPGKVVSATGRPQQILVRTPGGTSAQRPQQVYIQTRQGGQQVLVPIQTLTSGTGTINLASLQGLQPRSQVTSLASSSPRAAMLSNTIPIQTVAGGRTITLPLSALQGRSGGLQTLQTIRQTGTGSIQLRQPGIIPVRQQTVVQRPQQFIVQQPGKQPQQLILQPSAAQQLIVQQSKQAQQLVMKQAQAGMVAFSPRPTATATNTVKLISAIPSQANNNIPAPAASTSIKSETLDTG